MSTFADLAASANTSQLRVFGEDVSYLGASGGLGQPATVRSIWSEDRSKLPENVNARVWALASAFPSGPAKNDKIQRGAAYYLVAGVPEPDGHGGLWLNLRLLGKQ